MNFDLNEQQRDIQRGVADLAKNWSDEYWADCDAQHKFPWEFYNAFAQAGWLGIAIPEEFGGAGLGILEASLMLEEVAASGACMNGASAMHMSIFGMQPVVKHGCETLKAATLPRVASGDLHVCFGVTEPDAGLDTTQIKTFARHDENGYLVNGRKIWISKALESEKILLLTRNARPSAEERRTAGMTLFLTDLQRDGVEIRPIAKMGRHAVDSNELFIDNFRIPESDVVGNEGDGFRYLLDGLNAERILVATEAVGIGRAALRRAVAYCKERIVFGRSIGKNQALQFPLAEAHARLEAATLVARKAAWLCDAGLPCGPEANQAKFLCADAAFTAADLAVQVHGGMGYATEYHVERYFREARLTRIAPVTQELALAYLGEKTLGLERSY